MWASLPFASSPEHGLPRIKFLFIGSRLCSALLSGPTSRWVLFHPCARYHFTSIALWRGLVPPSCRSCSAHKQSGRPDCLGPPAMSLCEV